VALSFLGARDFAAASRVSCLWRRAAELQSAWPEFSVQRINNGVVESKRSWHPGRRIRAATLTAAAKRPRRPQTI
jgi:beta-galactosidase/beta-glucuronidase